MSRASRSHSVPSLNDAVDADEINRLDEVGSKSRTTRLSALAGRIVPSSGTTEKSTQRTSSEERALFVPLPVSWLWFPSSALSPLSVLLSRSASHPRR